MHLYQELLSLKYFSLTRSKTPTNPLAVSISGRTQQNKIKCPLFYAILKLQKVPALKGQLGTLLCSSKPRVLFMTWLLENFASLQSD
jgi:hypothetical protein